MLQELTSIQDMTDSIEDALKVTVEKVDAALMEACKSFDTRTYAKVRTFEPVLKICAYKDGSMECFHLETVALAWMETSLFSHF
jgi:hypothetical protein